MIAEQDKQAILNGAWGITRDGRKCKVVYKNDDSSDKQQILIIIENNTKTGGHITKWLNWDLKEFSDYTSIFDIVGLLKSKPEPFDLEKALAGEPVMLRNGSKACVLSKLPKNLDFNYIPDLPLIGLEKGSLKFIYWTEDGRTSTINDETPIDIIGMWKEPEPQTVTLTLPCPVLEPEIGKTYYTPIITDVDGYDPDGDFTDITEWIVEIEDDGDIDWQSQHRLEEGLVFETKNDVKAWLNAMRSNRR